MNADHKRLRGRRMAASIYTFAAALLVIIALAGYTYVSNRGNDRALTQLSLDRQREINQFLRDQVCARFELRDEINIAILEEGRRRAQEAGDKERANTYTFFIVAIQNAQGDCVQNIPTLQVGGG